ncbi:unnamed protein product [Mytilus coruscus]|uniref:Uncharacterized protein n=1 Tax=Mytilus coruscus TaxID=42192 RepID=A0A6J8CSE2_MYTCO|nr:unnamed protein product [Mytilus coruscus]
MDFKVITLLFAIYFTFTDHPEFINGQIFNDETSKLPWNNTKHTPVFWENDFESTTLISLRHYKYSPKSSLLITTDEPREMGTHVDKKRITNATVIGQFHLISNQSDNFLPLGQMKNNSSFYISQAQTTEFSLIKNSLSSKTVSDLANIYPSCFVETCGVVANSSTQYCRCDEKCNDCCIDAGFEKTFNRKDDIPFECSPINDMRYNKTGIYIIKTCPADRSNSTIGIKCHNSDILAVGPWVVSETNVVFQNRFCAECNGINAYTPFLYLWSNVPPSYIQSTINLTIAGKIQYQFVGLYAFKYVKKELVPPDGVNVRQCIVLTEPTFNHTRDCLENTINPVFTDKDHVYRNKFCISPNRSFQCLTNFVSFGIDIHLYDLFPLSVMFPFTEKKLRCPSMVNGFCIENEIYENLPVLKVFSLVSTSKFDKRLKIKILIVMTWALSLGRKWTSAAVRIPTDKSVLITIMTLVGIINKKLNAYDMLKFKQKTLDCEWKIEIQSPEGQIYTADTENKVYDNLTYHGNVDTVYFLDKSIELVMDDYNISIGQNVSKVICERYIIRCEIEKKDSKLIVKEVRCDDGIIQSQLTLYVDSKSVITYTGIGLSVIALIVSVVVHRRLGLYKTIPGSNIENMSLSLLIADILFIVGVGANDHQLICYSIYVHETANHKKPKMTSTDLVDKMTSTDLVDKMTSTDLVDKMTSTDLVDKMIYTDLVDKMTSTDLVDKMTSTDLVDKITSTDLVDRLI